MVTSQLTDPQIVFELLLHDHLHHVPPSVDFLGELRASQFLVSLVCDLRLVQFPVADSQEHLWQVGSNTSRTRKFDSTLTWNKLESF